MTTGNQGKEDSTSIKTDTAIGLTVTDAHDHQQPSAPEVLALRRANTARKHELLFEAWDGDGDGFINLTELGFGINKHEVLSREKQYQDILPAARTILLELDTEEYQLLNKESFRKYVERVTSTAGSSLGLVSELLILTASKLQGPGAPLQKDTHLQEEKEEGTSSNSIGDIARCPEVEHLFACFNRSGSGQISFAELCHMLHKLHHKYSLREARAQAVNTMLFCDTDSKRALGKMDFARFLEKLATMMHMTPQALAGILLQISKQSDELPSLDDSATAFSMETRDATSQVYETLADRRLHLLFELWDKDGDGHISFAELALGFRKFSSTLEPATETASDAAEALLLFDVDSDQKLDRAEFARFINQFCEACGSDFTTLSEFLILLAALEDSPSEEIAYLLSEDKVGKAIAGVEAAWKLASQSPTDSKAATKNAANPSGDEVLTADNSSQTLAGSAPEAVSEQNSGS